MRNNKKAGTKFQKLTFGFVLLFFICAGWIRNLAFDTYYNQPIDSHEVTASSSLDGIWVRENVFIDSEGTVTMMVASHGTVAYLGDIKINGRSQVTALDGNNGALKWQKPVGIPTAISAAGADLFVGRSGGARVLRLEVRSGATDWETLLPGARGLTTLANSDEQVFVHTTATENQLFVLDQESGKIKLSTKDTGTFLIRDGVTYKRENLSTLKAIGQSQNVIWEKDFDRVFYLPVFAPQSILVRTDAGMVLCLEPATGDERWKTDNIAISNLAVGEDVVFFLSRYGKLVGVSLTTGETDYFVQFDTDQFILNGEAHIGGYYVAYDAETASVFASLGDSAQLFAFKVR